MLRNAPDNEKNTRFHRIQIFIIGLKIPSTNSLTFLTALSSVRQMSHSPRPLPMPSPAGLCAIPPSTHSPPLICTSERLCGSSTSRTPHTVLGLIPDPGRISGVGESACFDRALRRGIMRSGAVETLGAWPLDTVRVIQG